MNGTFKHLRKACGIGNMPIIISRGSVSLFKDQNKKGFLFFARQDEPAGKTEIEYELQERRKNVGDRLGTPTFLGAGIATGYGLDGRGTEFESQ
jgi:hypothetical protein